MKAVESEQALPQLVWHRSSYSSEEGGQCLEVASRPHTVYVRDSKDLSRAGLILGTDTWTAFVEFATE